MPQKPSLPKSSKKSGELVEPRKSPIKTIVSTKGKKRYWLAYDLGVDGDFANFFTWLDGLEAVECAGMTCSFLFDPEGSEPSVAILAAIKNAGVQLKKTNRLYLIHRKDDGAMSGAFIYGKRQGAPWAGYSSQDADEDTDANG